MSQKGIELAHKKSLKVSYKHLSCEQKRIVKLHEELDLIEKFFYAPLSGFFARCPKKSGSGAVDWDKVDEKTLDIVDYNDKKKEKINKSLSKFTEDEINQALTLFKQTQFNYGQSF